MYTKFTANNNNNLNKVSDISKYKANIYKTIKIYPILMIIIQIINNNNNTVWCTVQQISS